MNLSRPLAGFFVISAFVLLIAAAPLYSQGSTVTMPLKEYESLLKSTEKESLTILESINVSGSMRQKSLQLNVKGRSTGKLAKVPLLKLNGQFALSDCRGDALLSPEPGGVFLVPLKDAFTLTCSVGLPEQEKIEMEFLSPTLRVSHEIQEGDVILQDSTSGGTTLVISSLAGVPTRQLREPIGTGRYRLSILPNQDNFEYTFVFDNPNRSRVETAIPLVNNEAIRTVKTSNAYREEDKTLKVELLPGTNQVQIAGTFSGEHFRTPLPFEEQYLVIENHPMLNVTVQTEARRISPKDTGVSYTYRSAQGFLLAANDELNWGIQKMQVFSTLGYSISHAQYLAFVPAAGHPVVEARITVDNQGMPQMNLDIPGRPLYLEIDGTPQLLYKDEKSNLKIPLSPGTQNIAIQYETEEGLKFFSFAGKTRLPAMGSPVSRATVWLRIHRRWTPLGATFSRYFFSPVRLWKVVLPFILCFGFYSFLRKFGFRRPMSVIFSGLFLALSIWSMPWILAPVLFMAATGVLRVREKYKPSKGMKIMLSVLLFLVLTGLLAFGLMMTVASVSQRRAMSDMAGAGGLASINKAESVAPEYPVPRAYEGLPAKINIPSQERADIHFSESMVATGKPLVVRYFMVPAVLLRLVLLIAAVILLILVWKERRPLWGILKESYLKGRAEPQPK
jgi:hypothetical protein